MSCILTFVYSKVYNFDGIPKTTADKDLEREFQVPNIFVLIDLC